MQTKVNKSEKVKKHKKSKQNKKKSKQKYATVMYVCFYPFL